jgi:RNA polymerase sigma-70 factor (ECF subfamily)
MFTEEGAWKTPPADWGNPETALAQSEFMDVLARCLDKLPPATARVFTMREILELESDEIRKELSITANNLWVILHRARVSLRRCLEQNWFASPARR